MQTTTTMAPLRSVIRVALVTASLLLVPLLDVLQSVSGVAFTHFDANDVVRHPLVQRIVRAYEQKAP